MGESLSTRIGGYATNLGHALVIGLAFFFALFCVRILLKRDWPAALACRPSKTVIG
jgi:hypothetical protein